MDRKSDRKRRMILDAAKQVFIRKGFTAVTMKDIVEECGISRGGIYLYFSSVDEIFMQVIEAHNRQKLKESRKNTGGKDFGTLLDDYFAKQKNRLLNMSESLLMAMHEYRFTHKSPQDKAFYQSQFNSTKQIIVELLARGVTEQALQAGQVETLAVNIMYFIEGISMMAATAGVPCDIIDEQLAFLKATVLGTRAEVVG